MKTMEGVGSKRKQRGLGSRRIGREFSLEMKEVMTLAEARGQRAMRADKHQFSSGEMGGGEIPILIVLTCSVKKKKKLGEANLKQGELEVYSLWASVRLPERQMFLNVGMAKPCRGSMTNKGVTAGSLAKNSHL